MASPQGANLRVATDSGAVVWVDVGRTGRLPATKKKNSIPQNNQLSAMSDGNSVIVVYSDHFDACLDIEHMAVHCDLNY